MARAVLVLTETSSEKTREIFNLLKHVNGVKAIEMIDESYGLVALVEAESSDGIRNIVASELASRPGVVRCIVCSEHEVPSLEQTTGFERMAVDDYCWCVKEPVY